MPLPTLIDGERAFAKTELYPIEGQYYDAARHAGCLAGACVIEVDGPLPPGQCYRQRMAELYDVSISQVTSLEAGFEHAISGGRLDPAQFASDAFRRGYDIGRRMRALYRLGAAG